jgi:hypothetical protein
MTFTISLAAVLLLAFSALCFIGTTVFIRRMGGHGGSDTYGIGALFDMLIYLALWVVPSLLAWAVWATWLR